MALLRSEIAGTPLDAQVVSMLDGERIEWLCRIASKYDFSEALFVALKRCGAISPHDEIYTRLEGEEELCYFRVKRLENAYRDISRTLSLAGIRHIPLKGAVLRELYPSPLMRQSADIDVLVEEKNLNAAISALTGTLGYKAGKREFHDVSLYTADGMHLELHYNIKENDGALDAVLDRAWEYAIENDGYEYRFSREFSLFHILTHLVYHFVNGGCGIKPFSDMWLYEKKIGYDREAFLTLCRESGLEEFYYNVENLTRVWFDGEKHTPLTYKMEAHVIHNAICGAAEKSVVLTQSKRGGRVRYILSRIFMPYRSLSIRYPVLKKCPILLPIFEVVRWFSLLFGDKKRVMRELESTKQITDAQMKELTSFLSDVGLEV